MKASSNSSSANLFYIALLGIFYIVGFALLPFMLFSDWMEDEDE